MSAGCWINKERFLFQFVTFLPSKATLQSRSVTLVCDGVHQLRPPVGVVRDK